MSVYHRFYVKTNCPRQVEQLIIETLGGSVWLESNDQGEFLYPVTILREDQQCIQPARNFCRNLVYLDSKPERPKQTSWSALTKLWKRTPQAPSACADAPEAKWYWLPSIISFQSVEAARVARTLHESPVVEMVAVDDEISGGEDDSVAVVINSDHYLLHPPSSGGQQPIC